MTDEQKSWTVDDSTQASNPGQFEASCLRWLLHYPRWPLIWFGLLLGTAALGWFVHWSLFFLTALILPFTLLYWVRVREHFRSGCINAGVVVSTSPTLIAVYTDLSFGAGSYPVVKLIGVRLRSAHGQAIAEGVRVASVALYWPGDEPDAQHWDDFDPRPVDTVTTDPAVLQRTLDSIPADEWEDLKEGLTHVPQPYRPGTWKLWEQAS